MHLLPSIDLADYTIINEDEQERANHFHLVVFRNSKTIYDFLAS